MKSKKETALIPHCVLALFSGALLPLSLAPWYWWPLGLICTAVLALQLHQASPRHAYWLTALFGFGMFAVGASWVYVSMNVYGNASVPLSLLLTGIFVAALSLIFALPFLLFGALGSRHVIGRLLAFPAAWVLGEWGLSWILTGFPWVYLGYGHLDTWLSGWAPIAGVWGIGWIVAFSGAVAAEFAGRWLGAADKTPPLTWPATAAVLLWVLGWHLQGYVWTTTGQPIRVGVMQPATPQQLRWDSGYLDEIISDNLALSEPLWGNDLIVWPEAAIPELQHRVQPLLQQLDARGRHNNSTLISGLPIYDFDTQHYYNSAIALGNGSGQYRKQHLVPFGEYVPLENWLRGLIDFFDLPMSAFRPGPPNQPLLTANGYAIATAICYEIAYPELVRQLAPNANLLLTISNDTWFGDSLGPLQHLSMAQMRALENGKPLIRATNDGVTALIDQRGHITARLPRFVADTLSAEMTPRTGATPFSQTGSWPILALCVLGLVAAKISTRRKPQ